MKTFEYLTIEEIEDGFWLCGHGEYERGSVLEGQPRFCRLGFFVAVEEALAQAKEKYPGVPVEEIEHTTGPTARVPDCSPAGFDPADAGEAWGEEDY